MPELPDVERSRQLVEAHLVGRAQRIDLLDPSALRNAAPVQFQRQFNGHRFLHARRHGKWLILPTDRPTLLLHFGMTGTLEWRREGSDRDRWDRFVFRVDDGELRYSDRRKLGGVWVAESDADVEPITGHLGPDAYGISLREFRQTLDARRGALKTALMDQSVLSGLGNMLSDEVLWRARLHPARQVATLDADDLACLHRSLRSTLTTAVKAGQIPRRASWLRSVRDSESPTCPRCDAPLCRSRIGGRTSMWCPRCQVGETGATTAQDGGAHGHPSCARR